MPSHLEIPRFAPDAMRLHRKRAGLTQAELGRRLNVYDNVIYRWEKGKTPIPAADLRRVAEQLQVAPAQLQRPLSAPPTLTDLRGLAALTQTDLADRLHIKLKRLILWEQGRLGTKDEPGPLLAAVLGVGTGSISDYERTGRLPEQIAQRLARALRVTPDIASAAFLVSRREQLVLEQSA